MPSSATAVVENGVSSRQMKDNLRAYKEAFLAEEERLKLHGNTNQLVALYYEHTGHLYSLAEYDSLILVLHKIRQLLSNRRESASLFVYFELASAHHANGNMDSLAYWFKRTTPLISPGSPYYGDYLLASGLVSSYDGTHTQAIEQLLKAADIFAASGDQRKLAITYNDLAFDYVKLKDYNSQKKYLFKALDINKRLGSEYNVISGYNNLGVAYKEQNQLAEALRYYNMAYEALQKVNRPLLLAQNINNRANVLEKMEDFAQAEALYAACKKISEENHLSYGVMLSHLNLGNIKRLMGQFDAAASHLEKGRALSRVLKTQKEESLAYERLSWLARDQGDYHGALSYLNKFYTLNDSLENERSKVEVQVLQDKFNAEKRENLIISLSKSKIKQRLIIVLMGLSLLVLMILVQRNILRNRLLEQINRRKQEQMQHELALKEQTLQASTMQKASVRNIKKQLYNDLQMLIQALPYEQASRFSGIINTLKSELGESLLNEFEVRFLGVHDGFMEKIKQIAPDLTPTELRMVALMRLNLTPKEIANIINRSIGTVDNTRRRIRKKLHLREEDNLLHYLASL
jgi:tetratricopeptide (TPR) repeat protein/DNA-binding CsgD family transcriptional regulator